MPFVSECIWLYHDMKRICNQDPSLYLWCFQVVNSGFLSHNNDETISNLGTMLSYCQSGLYLYPSLVICPIYTYVVSILQKIMRTCKIRFKSKHHQYRYPNKFDYITNRVSTVTCSYFFSSVQQVGHTCISLQIQQECFSMYELWHQKLYQISVNIPQFSKTCHLR